MLEFIFAVACLAVLGLVRSETTKDYDPVEDFCRRFDHAATIVGDRLYISGGQVNLAGGGGENITNTHLLFHDLTQNKSGTSADQNMPPLITNLTKPAAVPSVSGSALWGDTANGKLFLYGGDYADSEPDADFNLWMYDIYANRWESLAPEASISRSSYGANTVVESSGKAYQLGGWLGSGNNRDWAGPRQAINKMLAYDMVEDSWTNATGPLDGMGRAEGGLYYVPTGDRGLLVHFGGVRAENGSEKNAEPLPLDQIDVYSIANDRWYTQTASGDIPSNRSLFCGGITSAADNSSHDIYIFGGRTFPSKNKEANGIADIYILSLPSFTWVKVWPAPGETEQDDVYKHFGYTCNVRKKGQMFVIGGIYPNSMDASVCDASPATGVHNVFLGKQNEDQVYWAAYNSELDTYEVPSELSGVIGGDGSGKAEVLEPEKGYNTSDLKVEFGRALQESPRAPTRCPQPGFGIEATAVVLANGTSCNSDSNSSGLSSGSKAGIAVGVAVAALLCLGFGGFMFFRRRQARKKAAAATAALKKAHDEQQQQGRDRSSTQKYNYAGSTNETDGVHSPRSPNQLPLYEAPGVQVSQGKGNGGFAKFDGPREMAMPGPGPAMELDASPMVSELPSEPWGR